MDGNVWRNGDLTVMEGVTASWRRWMVRDGASTLLMDCDCNSDMDGKGRRDGDLTVMDGAVRQRWTTRRRLNSNGQQWTEQQRLESSRWIDSNGRLLDGDGRPGATAMDGATAP